MVDVGPAKIDFQGASGFALFNKLPEQKRHAAKVVESVIRTTVFVKHGRAMPEGQNGCDRSAIFPSKPNLDIVAHTFDQVVKPGSRLGEQLMAPSCDQQELVEIIGKLFGAAHFICERLPFGFSDPALNAVFMEAFEKPLQTRLQVEFMKAECMALAYTILGIPNFR
jgi:hypothetical protein